MSSSTHTKDYERGIMDVVAELRKRRAGLNGQFEWEKGQITMSEQMKAKMAAAEFEKEIVKRAYDTARDHASDDRAVMEIADDIQYLMTLAFRKGQRS